MGDAVGVFVGEAVGNSVGLFVGACVGDSVGKTVGDADGTSVGVCVGESVMHSPSSINCFAEPAKRKLPPPYQTHSFESPTSSGGQ